MKRLTPESIVGWGIMWGCIVLFGIMGKYFSKLCPNKRENVIYMFIVVGAVIGFVLIFVMYYYFPYN